MARKNDSGYVEMTWTSFDKLINLAREGLYSRNKIQTLKAQIVDLSEKLELVTGKFSELYNQTKRYFAAMRFAPDHVNRLISKILSVNKIKGDIMLNTPRPSLFRGWKSKNQHDMNRDRERER